MIEKEIITQFKSENEIQYIPSYGGIYGMLQGSQDAVLNKRFKILNARGWRVITIYNEPPADSIMRIARIILLIITLCIYTPKDGFYVLLEKSSKQKKDEILKATLFI